MTQGSYDPFSCNYKSASGEKGVIFLSIVDKIEAAG